MEIPNIFILNMLLYSIIMNKIDLKGRKILYELDKNSRQTLTQIGKKCHTGCAISQLVGKCVMPKEGIFTKVLKEGIIRPGDSIEIV